MGRWHDWIDGKGRDTMGHQRPKASLTDEECFPLVIDRDGDVYAACERGGWSSASRDHYDPDGDWSTLDALDRVWGPLTAIDVR